MQESQNRIDDLKDTILDNRLRDSQLVRRVCKRLITEANRQNDEGAMGFASYYWAETGFFTGETQLIIPRTQKAIISFSKIKNEEMEGRSYNLLGVAYIQKDDYQRGLEYYLKAMEIAQRGKLRELKEIVNNNIGVVYFTLKDYEEALKYFKRGLSSMTAAGKFFKLADKEKEKMHFEWLLNLADTYVHLGNIELADYYMQQLEGFSEGHDICSFTIYFYAVRAKIYFAMKDKELTCKMVDHILDEFKMSDIRDIFNVLVEVGECLIMMGDKKRAGHLLDILEKICKTLEHNKFWVKVYDMMIQYYKLVGDQSQLLDAYEKYNEYSKYTSGENCLNLIKSVKNQLYLDAVLRKQENAQEREEKMRLLAERDALTGLLNRYSLNKLCYKCFEECKKKNRRFGIIFIDVDNFKYYNDSYGHLTGDSCLQRVAKILGSVGDGKHMFGRFGGDEFIGVMIDLTHEEVKECMAVIQQQVKQAFQCVEVKKNEPRITVTQGSYCSVPEKTENALDFIQRADEALYYAKGVQKGSCYCRCDIK